MLNMAIIFTTLRYTHFQRIIITKIPKRTGYPSFKSLYRGKKDRKLSDLKILPGKDEDD